MQPYDQVKILDEILEERTRQDEKWGPIDDVWDRSPLYWLAILTEELGEVAKAMIEPTYIDIASDGVRQELIQTAAVAVSWLEAIDHATEARR